MNTSTLVYVHDWNGTLFDDFDVAVQCYNEPRKFYKLPPISQETFRTYYDLPFVTFFENLGFFEGSILSEEDKLKRTRDILDYFRPYYLKAEQTVPLREGVADFLDRTTRLGIKHVILSNHLVPAINQHAQRLGVLGFFSKILANSSVAEQTVHTPKGERLRLYVAEEKIAFSDIVIFGDTPEETRIARQLGCQSASITGGWSTKIRLEKEEPDYLFDTFNGLDPLLKGTEWRRPTPSLDLS